MGKEASSLKAFPRIIWPAIAIVVAWGLLINQVRLHWGGESYYNFGWFVPFLATVLFLRNLEPHSVRPLKSVWIHLTVSLLCILPIIPFHAFSEINPFWRLPFWIQAVGLCGFTLAMIHSVYGWRGVWASLFPLFFLTTMIPWPYRIEIQIVQSLTGVVTELAVSSLRYIGYPVEVAGNSIVLGELNIGVNEACSGIRSLQALFMVTLFLGSLFAQSTWRRIAAVVVLPFIVILVNSARAVFLSTQVITNGYEAYDSWHDPAGYIAFAISMVLIYACIEIFNIGYTDERSGQGIDFQKLTAEWKLSRLPAASIVLPIAPILLYAAVEGWFGYHESRTPANTEWTAELPNESKSVRYLPIDPSIEENLGFGYGERLTGRLSESRGYEVYYYGYREEDQLASISSFVHSPSVCMQAVGARRIEQFPDLIFEIENLKLPLHHYLFEMPQTHRKLHVFWIFWEHRNMGVDPEDTIGLDYGVQLDQLLRGRRDYRRKVLLTSMVGYDNDMEGARRDLEKLLTDWIQLRTD
jgi:exosortase